MKSLAALALVLLTAAHPGHAQEGFKIKPLKKKPPVDRIVVAEGELRLELEEPAAEEAPRVEAAVPEIGADVAAPQIAAEPEVALPEVHLDEAAPAAEAKAEGGPASVVVQLRDGTVIVGQPTTPELTFETQFGKLTIPFAELRSAAFGLRVPPKVREKAEAAIETLGGDDFKKRDAAHARLVEMGPLAAEAVAAALGSDLDPETLSRLQTVALEIAPEGFDEVLLDTVRARAVRASGRVVMGEFEIESTLGRLKIDVAKLEELRIKGDSVFSEGFESFRSRSRGWGFAAATGTAWQTTTKFASSGRTGMWCGIRGGEGYGNEAQATLTSPPINTSSLDRPTFSFNYFLAMEDGADFCRVEFSKDGGKNWEGGVQFSSNGGWANKQIDVSHLRSPRFRFRFIFQSDESETDVGMRIDDLVIDESDAL